MAKIFDNSYTRAVYYKAGTMNGRDVYRRAPFDLVVINGSPHVQPHSIDTPASAFARLTTNSGCNLEDTLYWRGGDIGRYEVLDPVIVDECQMGDSEDTFFGLHAMSLC